MEDLHSIINTCHGKYEVSNYFPIDVKEGLLINPQSNSFAGNLPFLNEKDIDQIAVIVINELAGSYRGPEHRNRQIYMNWSKKINGKVSVSINNTGTVFYKSRWLFENGECKASGYEGADVC